MSHLLDLLILRPKVAEDNLHNVVSSCVLLDNYFVTFECDLYQGFVLPFPSIALKPSFDKLELSLSNRRGDFVSNCGHNDDRSYLLLSSCRTPAHFTQTHTWLPVSDTMNSHRMSFWH